MVDPYAVLTVTAAPVYRLAISPVLADSASRLLVISVRISSAEDSAFRVVPDYVTLRLPDGQAARVFDRPRAVEIVTRATLANADFSYLQRSDSDLPGGLSDDARAQLREAVVDGLLADSIFVSGQTMQAFIVVDTGVPLSTLDGAAIEVVGYRVRDESGVRGAYQFAAVPPTPEAR